MSIDAKDMDFNPASSLASGAAYSVAGQLASRSNWLFNSSTVDSDAAAIIAELTAKSANFDYTANGGLGVSGVKAAINTFVKAGKASGWWAKCYDLMPYIGQTNASHTVNWRKLGVTGRYVTFHSTPSNTVHDADGWKSASTSGNTAQITDYPSAYVVENPFPCFMAVYTDVAANLPLGARGGGVAMQMEVQTGKFSSALSSSGNAFNTVEHVAAQTGGFFIANRPDSLNLTLYKNAVAVATKGGLNEYYAPAANRTNLNGLDGVLPATIGVYQSFYAMGLALTTTQISDLYSAVQELQSALGRAL